MPVVKADSAVATSNSAAEHVISNGDHVVVVNADSAISTPCFCDAEHVLSNDDQLTHQLGTILWPQLSHHYVNLCMKPHQRHMTHDESQLQSLLAHVSTAEEFESAAVKLL